MGSGMGAAFIVSGLAFISVIGFASTWTTMQKRAIQEEERIKMLIKETDVQQMQDKADESTRRAEESSAESESVEIKEFLAESAPVEFELVKDETLGGKTTKTELDVVDIKDFLSEPPVKRKSQPNVMVGQDGHEVLEIKDFLSEPPPKKKSALESKSSSKGVLLSSSPKKGQTDLAQT